MSKLLNAFAKFKGGASVPHSKQTAPCATRSLPAPAAVIIPLQQHIGAPCQPLVKKRDLVAAGQLIADTDAFVAAPIHAPISGKITAIKPILLANGRMCDAIHIENDGLNTFAPELQPISVTTKEELLLAARASGLVGIGGAGFPLHVKLANTEHRLDTLLINAAECEPFITSDYREMIEHAPRIIAGIQTVMNCLQLPRTIIGIENNKPEAQQLLMTAAEQAPETIDIMTLPTRYPQGAEKLLIYAATGRKVALGQLPAQAGCLVMNVSTISLLQHYLETGIPLLEKRLTVDGDNIATPQNVAVPIGTPISEIIAFCGGFVEETGKVILGGPMMGIAQFDLELPITKQNNALLALTGKAALLPEESPCIRCGRCVTACPLSLLPVQIERAAKLQDTAMLKKLQVSACMECGCCSYVCPAGRKLVQYMKQAKILERGPA